MEDSKVDEICDNGKMIYCIDIDGTLTEIISKTEAKPREEMINIVRTRYAEGNYIILYTARNFPDYKNITKKWLKKHNIPYHELHFKKPKTHIYIDDCAVNTEVYLKDPNYYDEVYLKRGNKINKLLRGKNEK